MALSNAERQRLYRERHRAAEEPAPKASSDALNVANRRIRELEEEVRHLKRQLSARSQPVHGFGSPRPAPKPSQSPTSGRGRVA